ncbi:MAG: right-handed parallel beta-helix repeat-containing protein, partial [candidate division Zixibacteria bacterium]|nr:right-handed parallel beta-helix repeat-containing protein [candidate division Zixibacteria bacterium]
EPSGWSDPFKFRITGPYEVPSEFPDIQSAINAIPYSDTAEVLVAPGTYTGRANCNPNGFYSKLVQLRSSSGPSTTFIDCGDSLRGFYFDWYTEPGTSVEGFTIRNARGYEDMGGAIDCDGAPVTINNCVIEYCPDGGVFIRNGARATITNCVVENCFRQGVLIREWSRATITNCTIRNNEWLGINTSGGGRATITGSTFQENMGVGLRLDADSNSVITNCDFIRNQEGESTRYGAYVYNSKPTFQSCNFLQNEGPGLYSSSSNLNIDNCTFTGNNNSWKGGGIYARNNSVITLTNSTFEGNTADYGAGIFLEGTAANLAQCLFDGNIASNAGGGVYVEWNATVAPTGCTFVNNAADTGSAIFIQSDANAPESDGNDITGRPAQPSDKSLGGGMVSECLFAYNQQGAAIYMGYYAWIEIMCSNIYGNAGGNWVGAIAPYLGMDGNISADPLFCNASGDDYTVT